MSKEELIRVLEAIGTAQLHGAVVKIEYKGETHVRSQKLTPCMAEVDQADLAGLEPGEKA